MGKPLSRSEVGLEAAHQFALTGRLKKAIEKEEFMLFYQPQVDLGTGKIVGMEALLRWEISDFGMMPPSEFIPVAEESGLIVPLGEWVLKTACSQNKQWQNADLPRIPVSVNLSGRRFRHQNLAEKVAAALQTARLEAQWLDLEITDIY